MAPASVVESAEEPPIGSGEDGRTRRPTRLALLVVIPIGVVLALLIVVLGTSKAAVDRTEASPLIGKEAPAVKGATLSGQQFDLGRQSSWVLVNFFASWCIPCRQEHPELRAFAAEHAAKGDVSLVSVVFGDEPADVRRFFKDNGGSWPVVLDSEGRIALDYAVAKVPETFLVAPDGTVVYKIVSSVTRVGLDRLIAQAEKPR
jgi:cytochrome c biogenesis protein CcmG/thiol:disulfide interchange protein DsbE